MLGIKKNPDLDLPKKSSEPMHDDKKFKLKLTQHFRNWIKSLAIKMLIFAFAPDSEFPQS